MTIKYKDLDIELDDLEGLDDDLDGFIAEAKIANELFFQDQFDFSEDSEELEELEDVIYRNLEKFIHYNKHLKTDFDRARALAVFKELDYDISWVDLETRGEIYMFAEDNDFDIVEKKQKISYEAKLDWVISSSSGWSIGRVLEEFFKLDEAIDEWEQYAIEQFNMPKYYSAYEDQMLNTSEFPKWFLNVYKYKLSNEEMVERIADENGYSIYKTEINYRDKKYNFVWSRS